MTKKGSKSGMIRQKLDGLETWVNAFIRDVKTLGLSEFTHAFYKRKLAFFLEYSSGQQVTEVTQISPDTIRGYIAWLQTDHKRDNGGRHAGFRVLRAFLQWWERETEPDNWQNPIKKIRISTPKNARIPGIPAADVASMLETCKDDFIGWRDKALMLCLLDTGARVREFFAVTLEDVDLVTGAVTVRKGKGIRRGRYSSARSHGGRCVEA